MVGLHQPSITSYQTLHRRPDEAARERLVSAPIRGTTVHRVGRLDLVGQAAGGGGYWTQRLMKVRDRSQTSRQPWSMDRPWPRLGMVTASVTRVLALLLEVETEHSVMPDRPEPAAGARRSRRSRCRRPGRCRRAAARWCRRSTSPRPLPPPSSRDRSSSSRTNRSKTRVPLVGRDARPVVGDAAARPASWSARTRTSTRVRRMRARRSRAGCAPAARAAPRRAAHRCRGHSRRLDRHRGCRPDPRHLLEHDVVEVDQVVRCSGSPAPRRPGRGTAGRAPAAPSRRVSDQQVAGQLSTSPSSPGAPARPRAACAAG